VSESVALEALPPGEKETFLAWLEFVPSVPAALKKAHCTRQQFLAWYDDPAFRDELDEKKQFRKGASKLQIKLFLDELRRSGHSGTINRSIKRVCQMAGVDYGFIYGKLNPKNKRFDPEFAAAYEDAEAESLAQVEDKFFADAMGEDWRPRQKLLEARHALYRRAEMQPDLRPPPVNLQQIHLHITERSQAILDGTKERPAIEVTASAPAQENGIREGQAPAKPQRFLPPAAGD